jgi:transcription-repair coupling factor (superfamily II helicase)
MDRLVCGDVGFGKTEVAMRAAFVAVQDGWQVAVLVSTTLLAQQHDQNFRDRFADWPVRVEQLSRFRSKKELDGAIRDLAEGRVDIVIGTHKLLQEGLRFKRLGLVVIDEEHRFGVRHKERFKALRAEVDVLTLTATPIPRTLHMAFSGLRDLSLIATPPARRLSIKTFVHQWDDRLLREACLREVKRGGQVFFVHNEVETIERVADQVAGLVPEGSVRVAHGQMRERELEQVMLDFYHRRFNLLVCTTIIETGIDVPNANTIVVNRADRFGLAQLHQLRGRVGRSHHRAYAYLVVPHPRALTADAVKRLEAIESLEDLGIGFTLATHDLEIRGAGELLGQEQSGQMHEVGYALYAELLERAVQALKAGRSPELDRPLDHGTEVDLHVPALIPEDYLPDVHTRLILYKRIASARSAQELRELQVEMIDRFGLLPEPTRVLFRATEMKLRATPLGLRKIDLGSRGGRLLFGPTPNVDPANVIQLIQGEPTRYRLDGPDRLRVIAELPDAESRLRSLGVVLDRLGAHAAA